MCGGDTSWKREEVPEHKFDFIDVRDFRDTGSAMRLKYLFMYAVIFKSFIVYISDIFTAITKLTTVSWAQSIIDHCALNGDCFYIPTEVNKWLFVGCIIFSFLLLGWEGRKARKIIASRDISYAFTNVMANRYYCLRSYDHFCFFDHISNSTKKQDDFAFFIFFTFKGWKRLLLADTPRQTINALTLYSLYFSTKDNKGAWWDIPKYFVGEPLSTQAVIAVSVFTVLICAVSLITLAIASICYIPLLFYIQGNLKEYVCHKVDKRTAEFIKRRNKVRHARAAKLAALEAKGDFSHLGNDGPRLPQPTLPQVSLDDDEETVMDYKSIKKSLGAPSEYGGSEYQDHKTDFPPPMPGYGGFNDADSQYNSNGMYDDEYATSQAHLTSSAAPIAGADAYDMNQMAYRNDAQSAYQSSQHGYATYAASQQGRSTTPGGHYEYDQYSHAPQAQPEWTHMRQESLSSQAQASQQQLSQYAGHDWPRPPTHSQPPSEMHEMQPTRGHDAGYHAM